MSNNVIPNFLPPPYDLTTEGDEETEDENENTCERPYAYKIFCGLCGVILGLAFYRLMDSEVNVSFKFSVSKGKNKS